MPYASGFVLNKASLVNDNKYQLGSVESKNQLFDLNILIFSHIEKLNTMANMIDIQV